MSGWRRGYAARLGVLGVGKLARVFERAPIAMRGSRTQTFMPDIHTAMKKISDLATVIAGFSPQAEERREQGEYLVIGGRNIKDGKLITTDADSYVDTIDRGSFRRAVALPGGIIVSTLFGKRKLYL